MKTKSLFVLTLGLICVLSVACGAGGSSAQTVRITEADANKMINLHKGDTLEIVLTGNPSTGFTWEAVTPPDSAILQSAGQPAFTPDSSAVGSPGKSVLDYQAIGTGQTSLQLVYHRSFETDTAPTQTFTVNIAVD